MAAGMDPLDECEPCGGCGRAGDGQRPVSWSPAYSLWLCGICRSQRVAVELAATERANAEARYAAHVAAKKT